MNTHKAVKYYLSYSKNQVQTCKIFSCSERSLMRLVDKYKYTNNITIKKKRLYIKSLIVIFHL